MTANLGSVRRRQGRSKEAVTLLHEALDKLPPSRRPTVGSKSSSSRRADRLRRGPVRGAYRRVKFPETRNAKKGDAQIADQVVGDPAPPPPRLHVGQRCRGPLGFPRLCASPNCRSEAQASRAPAIQRPANQRQHVGSCFALPIRQLKRFLDRPFAPATVRRNTSASSAGAPIGDVDMDWLGRLAPFCSWQ